MVSGVFDSYKTWLLIQNSHYICTTSSLTIVDTNKLRPKAIKWGQIKCALFGARFCLLLI